MSSSSVAVQGVGFGALSLATQGLLGAVVVRPEVGPVRWVEALERSRECFADRALRLVQTTERFREALAATSVRDADVDDDERRTTADPTARVVEVADPTREATVDDE